MYKSCLMSLRIFSIGIFFLTFTMIYSGCRTDGCTDYTAANFDDQADTDDGTCTYYRDGLLGTYAVNGTVVCDTAGSDSWDNKYFIVTADPSSTTKIKLDFSGNVTLTVNVAGPHFLSIEPTMTSVANYSGSGTYDTIAKTIDLSVTDISSTDQCHYTVHGSR